MGPGVVIVNHFPKLFYNYLERLRIFGAYRSLQGSPDDFGALRQDCVA